VKPQGRQAEVVAAASRRFTPPYNAETNRGASRAHNRMAVPVVSMPRQKARHAQSRQPRQAERRSVLSLMFKVLSYVAITAAQPKRQPTSVEAPLVLRSLIVSEPVRRYSARSRFRSQQ